MAIVGVFVLGLSIFGFGFHEYTKESCNWEKYPPSNFNETSQDCNQDFRRIGCYCLGDADFRENRNFFGAIKEIEG